MSDLSVGLKLLFGCVFTFEFTGLTGCLELFVPVSKDLEVAIFEAVQGRDKATGTVKTHRVAVLDEIAADAFGIFKAEGRFGADGLFLQSTVKAFQFAVTLKIMR